MLHQCRKKSPVFTQSTPPTPLPPYPQTLRSLSLSFSRFPSNRHTGLVHYYSPGFTKTRIIALLSTTVSGEARGGGIGGQGEEGKSKRYLMIEKNKSLLFSVLGHVYKHILPDSCMYAWVVLSSGWQKNLQGEYSWFSPQWRNLLSFVWFWIHPLPFIDSAEIIHSITAFKLLSALIYWQIISSMKMGTVLDFLSVC